MGPDPLNTADSNGSQPYREPFNADPYLPDAVADTPRGPVAGSKDDPLGIYPLRLLKKEAVDRKPAESAVLPKIVLPKGYTLDAPADAKASKAGTKPSPVKAFTGDEPKKRKAEKPVVPDLTSNEKGEGLFRMLPATQQGYTDTSQQVMVPFSKVEQAQAAGYHLHPDEVPGYAKDVRYQGQGPTWLQRVDQHIQKALAPEARPAPVEVRPGVFVSNDNDWAARNIARAGGRILYGAPGYAKQVKDAYLESLRTGNPNQLLDVIDPAQIPVGLYQQFQEDRKKDIGLAIQNLLGSLGGLAAVAKVAGKLDYGAIKETLRDRLSRTGGSDAGGPGGPPPPPGTPSVTPPVRAAAGGGAAAAEEAPRTYATGGTLQPQEGVGPETQAQAGGGKAVLTQEIEESLLDQVVRQHDQTRAAAQRDLAETSPQDHPAILSAIDQQGEEAASNGDQKAALEAAEHAILLEQIIAGATPPAAPAAPEVPKAAEPESQLPLFGAPEAEAAPAAEAPRPVGALTDAVQETMTRQQMLDELGVKKGSGDPRLRAQTKRLALAVALARLTAGAATPPAAAAVLPEAQTPKVSDAGVPQPIPEEGVPAASPEVAAPPETPAKAKKPKPAEVLADYYTPGNVVYSGYWGKYDKVLDFKPGEQGRWQVQVIDSDKDGNPTKGERPRWHSTYPDTKKDKVVVRAPAAAPAEPVPAPAAAAAAAVEPAAAAAAEPGYVGKAARKVAKSKGKAAEAAPAPVVAPPAPEAKPTAEVEWNAEDKTWEATAPEGYVDATGEGAKIAAAGKGKEFKTKAQARKAITEWEAGLIPVAQFRAQAPAAPPEAAVAAPEASATPTPVATPETPAPAAEPAPAPAPVAEPVSGPVKLKFTSGPPPKWQAVDHPSIAVQVTDDGYIAHDGGKFIGRSSNLDDIKDQIQEHIATHPAAAAPAAPAPEPVKEPPPLPDKPAGTLAVQRSFADAVARTQEQNLNQATAGKSTGHDDVPVIAVSDDAIVLLDKWANQAPVSNAKAMTGARADALVALMREAVAKDPEGRRGLAALADLMDAHRTPHGNVILHRHIMSDAEIGRILWEEQFHDWQLKYLSDSGAKMRDMHRAMNKSTSAGPWQTAINNLQALYGYDHVASTVEAPAHIAAGDYKQLGISEDEAIKLLADYKERARTILGSVATDNYPTHSPALEEKVNDEIRRRNLRGDGQDTEGGRGGRLDTQQPAQQELPEKAPTARARRKRAAEAAAGLSEAQSRQRQEERDLAPVWYLKSERVVADKMKGPMPGPDALRMLQNNGISQDELKWTGLDDYLPTAGRVTPDQVREHIAENGIRVEEVRKGEIDQKALAPVRERRANAINELSAAKAEIEEKGWTQERWEKVQNATTKMHAATSELARLEEKPSSVKYGSYQLPEGANYRELLLTLPGVGAPRSDLKVVRAQGFEDPRWNVVTDKGTLVSVGFRSEEAARSKLAQLAEKQSTSKFQSGHWDEPNIVTHVRMNDRTSPDGKQLLHIEEIQSDWHQKGRRTGYRGEPLVYGQRTEGYTPVGYTWSKTTRPEVNHVIHQLVDPSGGVVAEGSDRVEALRKSGLSPDVPDAPFKKTWQEMALRRMVRYAAEYGYDGVSWTGGEDHAERYSLAKHIGKVEYNPDSKTLDAWSPDNRHVFSREVEPAQLPNYIGKEVADRLARKIEEWESNKNLGNQYAPYKDPDNGQWIILDANGDPAYDFGGGLRSFDREQDAWREIEDMHDQHREALALPKLEGLDLKVGGEGMHGFYDKIVPDYLNKFGKKFGARVGRTSVEVVKPEARQGNLFEPAVGGPKTVQYLPITDEMFDSVLREGVPLFQNRQLLEKLKEEMEERKPSVDWRLPPEEKRRPIKSFVSPNVFNLETVADALSRLGSKPHKLMQQESDWLLGELGSKVRSRSAVGVWEDGAENSLIHEFPPDTDPDLVVYHNALMARAGWQKSMYNFFPQDDGADVLYRARLPKSAGGPEEITKVLADHGVNASTIIKERDGHAVFIGVSAAEDDATKHAITKIAEQLGGKNGEGVRVSRYGGRSEYVGEDDRDRAGEVFSRVIAEQENLHPEWRDIRVRLESRPDFVELGKLVKTEKLDKKGKPPEGGIGELQSRRRLLTLKEEAERLKPHGSTVPMMESVLLGEHFTKIGAIAQHLEDQTRETLRRLHPGETSAEHNAMVNRAVMIARDELKYQLAQENSGVDWYTKDIRAEDNSLMSEMKKLHPELSDPAKERLFLLHVAMTSPGKAAAFDNVNIAERAYDLYKTDGEIPLTQPDGTSWGSYGNAPIKTVRGLLRHFRGDEAKAMEWMLTKHPITELEQVKKKSGHNPNTVKAALPPDYNPDEAYGAYILGPKVGPFFLNLNGVSTELTVDRWYMRTWNRLMGTLVSENGEIQDVPRGKSERAAMIEATRQLEEEFGLTTSQVQAALWYYEQGLYSRLGQRGTFGGTYANAAKAVHQLRSQGHASIGDANAWRWDDAERGETRGSAGAYPKRARGKNIEGEEAGSQGGLFGDSSFDFGKLETLQSLMAKAALRDPRRAAR